MANYSHSSRVGALKLHYSEAKGDEKRLTFKFVLLDTIRNCDRQTDRQT